MILVLIVVDEEVFINMCLHYLASLAPQVRCVDLLELYDVKVSVKETGRRIVHGVTARLTKPGIYIVMGPNGAGKSSLANAVMGHEAYRVEGRILLDGQDITGLSTAERALRGLTLASQNPEEIEGVRVSEVFARIIKRFRGVESTAEALGLARELLETLGLPASMLNREYMVGMSGGERKKLELARVLAQKPKVALLDEPDSGVDVESLRLVANAVGRLVDEGSIVVLITHQPRLLHYLEPSEVYVMYNGRVVAVGGYELVERIENEGYGWAAQLARSAGAP